MLTFWPLLALAATDDPLDRALAGTIVVGGPSGVCPDVGKHDPAGNGTYGTRWQPVGFSPRGSFASLWYEDADGEPRWVFSVQSLVDDKELVRITEDDPEGKLPPREQFIERHRAAIDAALAKYGIAPASHRELGAFPRTDGPDIVTVTVVKGEKDYTGQMAVRATMVSTTRGSKTLQARQARDYTVLGYLKSPYEPRAAVVVAVKEPAYEGVTDCRIRVVGAHLETGFR